MSWSEVRFFVPGVPQPKGNHRAGRRDRRAKVYDTNDKLGPWERAVAAAALPWHSLHPEILDGPVALELRFTLPRPKTVRRPWPTARSGGDLDKLIRAVGDALAGLLYADDSQVVKVTAEKTYAAPTESVGCFVAVRAL